MITEKMQKNYAYSYDTNIKFCYFFRYKIDEREKPINKEQTWSIPLNLKMAFF